jgi:hypothetical protein
MKTYAVINNPDGQKLVVADSTLEKFYSDARPIQSGMSHSAAWKLISQLNTKPSPAPVVTMDFEISSGLGIGGVGSDDYNIHTEIDAPVYAESHKCGRGQRYDERCDRCRRITTVCNDCGRCSRCHGG